MTLIDVEGTQAEMERVPESRPSGADANAEQRNLRYSNYLRQFSKSPDYSLPGYYVEGAQSEFEVQVLKPTLDLMHGIAPGEDVLEHIGRMLEEKDPAIDLLFGLIEENEDSDIDTTLEPRA